MLLVADGAGRSGVLVFVPSAVSVVVVVRDMLPSRTATEHSAAVSRLSEVFGSFSLFFDCSCFYSCRGCCDAMKTETVRTTTTLWPKVCLLLAPQ